MRLPVVTTDSTVARSAANGDRRIVLLTTVNLVFEAVVRHHPIELRRRLIVLTRPALRAVETDIGTTVIGIDHPVRVVGIDPQIVVVAVRHRNRREAASAVDRFHERRVQHVDRIRIVRIGEHVHVVPGSGAQNALFVDLLPAVAAIVGSIQPTVITLGLDDRPYAARLRRRRGNADLAHAVGEPICQLFPGLTAIRRAPDAAALAAGAQLPGRSFVVPQRGVQDARVGIVERQVDGARGFVLRYQHLAPGLTTVGRLVDAGVVGGLVRVPLSGNPHDVGILWVNANLADLSDIA